MAKGLLDLQGLITALKEVFHVVKDRYKLLYFPDLGGGLLLSIFKRIVKQHNQINKTNYSFVYFSSKIAALGKTNLKSQLISILTEKERSSQLSHLQISKVLNFFVLNPSLRDHVDKTIGIGRFLKLDLPSLVNAVSDYGLFVPSEDKQCLMEAGIIDTQSNVSVNGLDYSKASHLSNLKKKLVPYIVNNLDSIVHPSRDLLNILFSTTVFAKLLKRYGKIYVVDEAISRGRTLNSFDIVFQSFYKNINWKIGVVYSSEKLQINDKINYIYTYDKIPFFSNRFDFVGKIVFENKIIKVLYITKLLSSQKFYKIPSRSKAIVAYNKMLKQYIENVRLYFDVPISISLLKKLLFFLFVTGGQEIQRLDTCLNLKISYHGSDFIEECDFYVHLPNPFKSIIYRKKIVEGLKSFAGFIFQDRENKLYYTYCMLKKSYLNIKLIYQKNILQTWLKKHDLLEKKITAFIP